MRPDLRVRLADRSPRETNPLLSLVSALLELGRSRLTASQVLDLADRPPVRRRFGFDDDDLSRIRSWVGESGVRWGLDAPHRVRFRLERVGDGTWHTGLDRVLLGVAMADESRLFGGALPLDDVGSSEIDLAGRLSEFVSRLGNAVDALGRPRSPRRWRESIAAAVAALAEVEDRMSWQRAELGRVLEDTLEVTGPTPDLAPAEVRTLLAHRLAGRPTRANFRTGHLTVCTLVPMRAVPHRVVCLLGLDDGFFPRRSPRDGDDLTLADPHVGDRDPRIEDRQMLLDALLAAGQHLVITYTGADERTNIRRPPAVPLGELLDEIRTAVDPAPGFGDVVEQVLSEHPLQSFDPRNFTRPEPWSFDETSLAGARSLRRARTAPAAFLGSPLDDPPEPNLELDRLIDFAGRPVRAFLRQRLGIFPSALAEGPGDGLPVELDELARYAVGQRLLEGVLAGRPLEDCEAAELARGTLPPGDLARPVLAAIRPQVLDLAASALTARGAAEARSLEINLTLDGGRRLTGGLPGVHGDTLLEASFSRLKPRHRLAAWLRLLVATCARPQIAWHAVVVARAPASGMDGIAVVRVPALGDDPGARRAQALTLLERFIAVYDRGMREPLPLGCATAAAFARAARSGEDTGAAAAGVWDSRYGYDGEGAEREHALVFGDGFTCANLLELMPRADELDSGWPPGESSRLGGYARMLWDELLEREQVSNG